MYSICMRYTQCPDRANDVFQESFYRIYKNIHQLKNVDALSGWIKSIFINTAIEYLKTKPIHSEKVEHQASDLSLNWNEAISNLSIEEITKVIQELPVGCQTVFNMYVIDGYSHKEIAESMQISVGTSKSQLHDARTILKRKLAHRLLINSPLTKSSE